jgi:dihydroceramide fatty acyl 2-hydroxylase
VGALSAIGLVVAGLFAWTLLEYLLHRFLFHRPGRFFGKRHTAHHAKVADPRLALAPPASSLGGAALLGLVTHGLLGWPAGSFLLGGILAGYLAYEWVHWSTHYVPAKTRVGKWLRAYHMTHHHKLPHARFGVTSPLWDLVFGTYEPKPRAAKRVA